MIKRIPAETTTYHFYNANPKGRRTTDCVVRAICTALEQDYNTTVMELAEMQCKTGFDDGDKKLYDKYLQSKGWVKHNQPKKRDNTKFTGKEFCKELNCNIAAVGVAVIANIGGHHIVCIKEHYDGDLCGLHKVYDTWDSTDGCIGNYWTKSR